MSSPNKSPNDTEPGEKIIRKLLGFGPFLYLYFTTLYLYNSHLYSVDQIQAQWKSQRQYIYLIYAFLFLLIGISKGFENLLPSPVVAKIKPYLPTIIVGFILVTFSYVFADLTIQLIWQDNILFISK